MRENLIREKSHRRSGAATRRRCAFSRRGAQARLEHPLAAFLPHLAELRGFCRPYDQASELSPCGASRSCLAQAFPSVTTCSKCQRNCWCRRLPLPCSGIFEAPANVAGHPGAPVFLPLLSCPVLLTWPRATSPERAALQRTKKCYLLAERARKSDPRKVRSKKRRRTPSPLRLPPAGPTRSDHSSWRSWPARTVRFSVASASTNSEPIQDRALDTMLEDADEVMATFAHDFPKEEISPQKEELF